MSDSAPVVPDLNRRHPDFAAFAQRLGRALGREEEAIQALKSAEDDKPRICLENDDLGSLILSFMTDRKEGFIGSANDLGEALAGADLGFDRSFWTVRRISKRLGSLWPHLEALFSATRKVRHGGGMEYSFSPSGDYGDCQRAVSDKVPTGGEIQTYGESALSKSPQSPPPLVTAVNTDFCQLFQPNPAPEGSQVEEEEHDLF